MEFEEAVPGAGAGAGVNVNNTWRRTCCIGGSRIVRFIVYTGGHTSLASSRAQACVGTQAA